jgi:hypothetical protein
MKIIDKPLIVSGVQLGVFQAYTDIEPELIATEKRTRVLPAPFFYEKRLFFYLINRYEPGQNKFFPNGGFEVRDESGGLRCYDLDQVIIHPAVIKHKKTLDKMHRTAEKIAKQKERDAKRNAKPKPTTTGKRGRPALDPALKAARDAEKMAKSERSGGKRGRPKSNNTPIVKTKTGGKRGRPKVSADVIASRVAAKAATRVRTGGKRGRPKSNRR